jgi:hypothetical protein
MSQDMRSYSTEIAADMELPKHPTGRFRPWHFAPNTPIQLCEERQLVPTAGRPTGPQTQKTRGANLVKKPALETLRPGLYDAVRAGTLYAYVLQC